MDTYKIGVDYSITGYLLVKADSPEDAEDIALDILSDKGVTEDDLTNYDREFNTQSVTKIGE